MTECLLKLCAHRAADGTMCGAPALRQSNFCRHHARVHRAPFLPDYVYQAHTLTELQSALHRTMNDLWNTRIPGRLSNQIVFELDRRRRALIANYPKTGVTVAGTQEHPSAKSE